MRVLAIVAAIFSVPCYAQNLNLVADTAHAPFIYGVASADPTPNAVLLWTAVEPQPALHHDTVSWQLSTDSTFTAIVATGSALLDSNRAYTIKVEATGLTPNGRYYYRFANHNQYSVTGTTYTAAVTGTDSLSLGLVSCSSLFSGYFNGYRQLAALPLKGLIHVGDYIYDFVDNNETVRVPAGALQGLNPAVLEEWRNRHRLYLTDPDLREARRAYPWICTWDNHDVIRSQPGPSSRAYREFVPFREDAADTLRIWRKVSYGPLLDIFMVDINLVNDADTFAGGSKKGLTDVEFNWLKDGLKNSTATWKIIGSEKLFSQWNIQTLPLPGSGLGRTWNGYPQTRDSLLAYLQANNINNVIIVSGDLHMNIWSDVTFNPFDSSTYNKATGNGSVAIEMMGTSISRGNLDEAGITSILQNGLQQASLQLNPHQQYINLFDHGFNTLTLNTDSLMARSYLCPILTKTNTMVQERALVSLAGQNRWKRTALATPITTPAKEDPFTIYPNPSANGLFSINIGDKQKNITVEGCDIYGRQVLSTRISGNGVHQLTPQQLPVGAYIFNITYNGKLYSRRVVVR